MHATPLWSRAQSTGRGRMTGFTLIEIMVVVVILGILASIVVPRVMQRPEQARIMKARQDIRAIKSALDLYRLDNFKYPTTDQGIEALVTPPADSPSAPTGGYLDKVPNDPWGNSYQYLSPGIKSEVDIFSYGADGAPGGDGPDQDVGSWDLD